MPPRPLLAVLGALVVAAPPALAAQPRDSTPRSTSPRSTSPGSTSPGGTSTGAAAGATAGAVRAAQPPALDGRDDDPVWRDAPLVDAFREFSPRENGAPRFRTTFRAAYDDRHLYVFVRAFDPHPDSLMTALTRRDVRGPSDQIKIMVDAYHDRRSGFEFAVNPVGVKRDYAMYNDRDEDVAWDGVWDVATRVDSAGWTAEFRIPFSQLRYANRADHAFGFAVWRDVERYKERTAWPAYRPSQPGVSSQMGVLTGIRDIVPFRRRELLPYLVTRNQTVALPGRPNAWGRAQQQTLGADLKYGITPNLTVDATINPDFGQVEADPAVVNLTAFEQFFQERRPFFLEGTGLYAFSQNSTPVNRSSEGLFYSRRIGRTPQLRGVYGDAASPIVTPILGAAKITGRLARGLNVGVLEAVTGREQGPLARTLEPRSRYTVARVQQDLRAGESSVGLIATAVNRASDAWTRDLLRREAYVVGTDTRHRWGKDRYEVAARLSASVVRGSAESIRRTQTSTVHLYQRPDDGLRVDSTRTSLGGDAQELSVAKFGGNMVRWLTSYERQSPGYEPNDLGFLRRANRQAFKQWVGLNWQKPTRAYRQMSGNFNYQEYRTADGLPTNRWLNTNWGVNLANNSWLSGGLSVDALPGSVCDDCARGGPAVRRALSASWNLGWRGDDRRRVVPEIFVADGYGERWEGRWRSRNPIVSVGAEVRPLPQLQASLYGEWNRNVDDVQWLGNFTEPTGVTRYAFARLHQQTYALTSRLSYAITPTLSLQLYAQPFASRGRYSNVRALSETPRAARYGDRYAPYTAPGDAAAGFQALQLRSNSVLRWEFRPGSTIFVVWQHGRDGYDDRYPATPWREAHRELFALHPANTFLVKMAWWLNP